MGIRILAAISREDPLGERERAHGEEERPVALADVGQGADASGRRHPKQVPGPSEAPKAWVPLENMCVGGIESLGVRPGYAARFVSLAMSAGWV